MMSTSYSARSSVKTPWKSILGDTEEWVEGPETQIFGRLGETIYQYIGLQELKIILKASSILIVRNDVKHLYCYILYLDNSKVYW